MEKCIASIREDNIPFATAPRMTGVDPEVVTTDGSRLYPAVLRHVFANSKQQLCLFHVMQNISKDILKGILAYRRSLPKPNRKKERPRNGEIPAYDMTIDLFKRRFLFVTPPENLNATNNDAERAARYFRRLQKSHYRLRKNYTIKNMLKHKEHSFANLL